MNTDLPYIQTFTNRHGKRFWYFRRKGWPKVRLPSPDSPGFLDAYQAAKNAQKPRAEPSQTVTAGSFSALCNDYERSRDYGSTRMLEHYVKKRDQAKLGRDAMAKWSAK